MKKTSIIALVIIALSVAIIMKTVAESSSYSTFTEASNNPDNEFHIVGTLNKGKEMVFEPEKNANLFKFYMFDSDSVERLVFYAGPKPQDFDRSEKIVIIGKSINGNKEFASTQILLKCPSKYNNGQEQTSLK
jgi:cytochrome c-type biogenesis protein CcmE